MFSLDSTAGQKLRNSPASQDRLGRAGAWLLLVATLLLIVTVRLHLVGMPLERDEGEYAYTGQLLLEGVPPYQEVYSMKLPGTCVAYAGIMKVFGQTPAGIHLGLLCVNAATMALVFLTGWRLQNRLAGTVAGLCYGLLSLSPPILGLQAHATHFVALFALGGIYVLLLALHGAQSTGRRHGLLLLAGVLMGMALLMKQQGVFFGIFGAFYILQADLLRRDRIEDQPPDAKSSSILSSASRQTGRLGDALSQEIPYALGFMLPYALTCALLWFAGTFDSFLFWTTTYASQYVASVSLNSGLHAALFMGRHLTFRPEGLLWALALVGLGMLSVTEKISHRESPASASCPGARLSARNRRFFLLLLFLFSVGSVSVGLIFRSHYFILLLPSLSLLCGAAVNRSLVWLKSLKAGRTNPALPGRLFLLAGAFVLLATAISNRAVWFASDPQKAMRLTYGYNLFQQAARAAETLRNQSLDSAKVAILGSEPEIPFLAHRRLVSGYIYMYPLMETQPFAKTMQQDFIRQIEQNQPRFVLMVDDDYSWLVTPKSDATLGRWWTEHFKSHYKLQQTWEVEYDLTEGSATGPAARHKPHLDLYRREGSD